MTLLTAVVPSDGQARLARTPYGWCLRAKGSVTARVNWHPDAILCRLSPDESDPELVQLAVGRVASRRCNVLFSPRHDEGLILEGDGLELRPAGRTSYQVRCEGPLRIRLQRDVMRVGRNLPWYTPLDRREFPRAPAGWCSWYFYYLNVTQDAVLRNAKWLARHLKPFGLEWVQVDDGWQGKGQGLGENRDWFTTCKNDFPRGMRWLADRIRRLGLRPGIWCIPLGQSDERKFSASPDLFVRRPDGRSPGERDEPLEGPGIPDESRRFEWMGRYTLDPTSPRARRELTRLFRMLCGRWGFEYVKIDAQGVMTDFYRTHRRQLADPALPGDEVYRLALGTMRRAMGPRRFLLNCGFAWDSAGLCQSIRTGGDVAASWEGMTPAIDNTMKWLYLNTLVWYTDPDVVCVREPLTLEQARAWVTFVGITGQVLMTSDDMPALPPDRVELLRRVLPVGDIHPMELYAFPGRARVFDVRVHRPGIGEWDVVACFNWDGVGQQQVELSTQRLGLPPHAAGWVWFDVWRQEVLAVGPDRLTLQLAPTSCRVVCLRPIMNRPQVVGTSRHLLQGADDLRAVRWDRRSHTLSGQCAVVAGDPYVLHVRVPPGWRPMARLPVRDGIARRVLRRRSNGIASWRIRFRETAGGTVSLRRSSTARTSARTGR